MENWIHEHNFDRLSIKQIVMPGTHDSGTYELDLNSKSSDPDFPKFLNKSVNNWAKTQNFDIYEQLMHGARYLDFRVFYNDDELKLIHGLTSVRIETAFEDILRFNISHPHEPIIIDCNHIYYTGFEDIHAHDAKTRVCVMIENVARAYFKNRLVRTNTTTEMIFNTPLNTIAGKIWLFSTHGQTYFNSDNIKSWWANTDNVNTLKDYVMTTEFDEDRLNVSQFILTIQPKTVILSYLNPFNKDTLEYYEFRKIKTCIQDMLISLKNKNVNVILVDFIELFPEVLNWCITTNTLKVESLDNLVVA